MTQPPLTITYLPVARLHPNPWNPNIQQPPVIRALSESIDTFGMVEPVTVRPHPDIDGDYEIINGEHRWREAQERELEELPCVVLEGLTDMQARKLTVILNEVSGDADVALLGQLLVDVQTMLPDDEALGYALPYSDVALQHLLALGTQDWDEFGGRMPASEDGLHTMQLKYAEDQYTELGNFLDIVERELELDRAAAVLEACRRLASELHARAA
jgi:ParB/Sulfiredoxin domain